MSEVFDLSSVSEVFHGSPQGDLQVITPRVSTHKEAWVYATPFLEMACTYLASWDDLDFAQVHHYGDFHLVERFPNAFQEIFPKGKGSIYCLPVDSFESFNYMEAISRTPVVPIKEIKIENSWEYIQSVARTKKLFLHVYPNRPTMIPQDDSDLIAKVSGWLKEKPLEWQSSSLYKRFVSKHPNLLKKLYESMDL